MFSLSRSFLHVTRYSQAESAFRSRPVPAPRISFLILSASSALCILFDSHAMRAMRAALLSVRSVLPVLSRSSVLARAPSRLVSTEAFAPATPLSKHIEQFVPTGVILTLLISIASVSAYYNGQLMSLKKEIEGTAATLKSDMAGIIKEVDAKNTGTKEAVDAKIAGFKEAADLKVRFLLGVTHLILSLTHQPLPLAVQGQVTCSSPSPSSLSPSFSGAALAALVAVQKQR